MTGSHFPPPRLRVAGSPPQRGTRQRETVTSDLAHGADDHGPVVGGGEQVAVAGALAPPGGLRGHCRRGLSPRTTDQVPLQQLRAGQDDPVVGERDPQPASEKTMALGKAVSGPQRGGASQVQAPCLGPEGGGSHTGRLQGGLPGG